MEKGFVFILSFILLSEQKAKMDLWLEEIVQLEIDEAKLKGLESTRKAINSWNHNEEYDWNLMQIPNITANELLKGKFKNFEEFRDHADKNFDYIDNNIEVLYRAIKNTNRDEFVYIIETLFFNE